MVRNFRRFAVVPLVAVGLVLASCGGTEPGVAVPVSTVGDGGGGSTGEPSAAAGGGAGGGYDQNRTLVLNDTLVRVVNVYTPRGSHDGAPVDVWVGSPTYGGKKLITVPYGQASEYFPVEVMNPTGDLTKTAGMDYHLDFYSAGKTTQKDDLMSQGENAYPGQKLTMVIAPNEPDNEGASLQVFADALGPDEKQSGFHTLSVPPAPSGRAVLLLGALALQYLGTDPRHSDPLTAATTDGKCVQYIESDTGKVHDPASSTTDLFGGTSALPFVVPAAAPIQVNVVKDGESVTAACADPPLTAPFDPKLAVGGRAYGFLYGSSMKAVKVLIVPTAA